MLGGIITTMTKLDDLQILSQWFSANFPIGGFSYSHGLDQLMDCGKVQNAADLEAALRQILRHGGARNDAILLKLSFEGKDVGALALALCASGERREESLAQGASMAARISALNGVDLEAAALPVVIGKAAAALGLDLGMTMTLYLQSWMGNLAMIALRILALSQNDVQSVIAALAPDIAEAVGFAMTATAQDLHNASFAFDLAAMRHETQEIRLCKT